MSNVQLDTRSGGMISALEVRICRDCKRRQISASVGCFVLCCTGVLALSLFVAALGYFFDPPTERNFGSSLWPVLIFAVILSLFVIDHEGPKNFLKRLWLRSVHGMPKDEAKRWLKYTEYDVYHWHFGNDEYKQIIKQMNGRSD